MQGHEESAWSSLENKTFKFKTANIICENDSLQSLKSDYLPNSLCQGNCMAHQSKKTMQ